MIRTHAHDKQAIFDVCVDFVEILDCEVRQIRLHGVKDTADSKF